MHHISQTAGIQKFQVITDSDEEDSEVVRS